MSNRSHLATAACRAGSIRSHQYSTQSDTRHGMLRAPFSATASVFAAD